MNTLRITVIPLLLSAGLSWSATAGGRPSTASPLAPPTADSLDDGPHVFWQNGTQPIVFYLCHGELSTTRLSPRDTVTFTGRCADSTTEYRIATRAPAPDRATWVGVSRILALSDVHGEYDAMVAFLHHAGVIDAAGHWSWGDGHLVMLGDVFDRGDQVTECLWFLYRLEREAARAGGHVHMVLGNHEMMVMRDDLRYVNAKYTDGIVRSSRIRYPDLFGPDMELGRWLRSKPLVLRINDILFVHGGLDPEIVSRGLSIDSLNAAGRAGLDLSSAALAFSDLPRLLFGTTGPLWYRGYLYGLKGRYAATTDEEIDATLRRYGASAIVVGHTENTVLTRLHGGKVYAIDVSLEDLGTYQGLLWENGTFRRVTGAGMAEPFD
jgi:hypothetical protein